MTSRILATASVVAIAFGSAATAQELPGWNPQTICTEDSTPQYCRFLESQARSQISQQWEFIPSKVRERCLKANEDLESESWREFGNCFADASRDPSSNGGGGVQLVQATTGEDASKSDEQVEALQAELDAAKARVSELEAAVASDSADADKIAGLEAELEKARSGMRSGEVRIEGLQQRLLAAVDTQDGTAGEAEAMQAALDKAEARARGAEFRSKALQSTLLETIARNKTAGEAGTASAERIATLEGELAKAQSDSRSGAVRIEGLQSRLMEANASADNDGSSNRIAELEAQIATLQEAQASAETDDGRLAELESALAKAQTGSKLAEARIEGLQSRLMEAQDAASGTESADLEAQAEQNRTRIADLEARLVQANKEAEASAGPDEETATKLAGLEADLEKAQASMRSGEVRIEGLQQRLMEASDRVGAQADGAEEAAAMAENLAVAQERIANLQSRLSTSRGSIQRVERERNISINNLDNARTRIAALQDAMIESRRAAAAADAAGDSAAEAKAAEEAQRLQLLLDNQRERGARVGEKVAEQRGRIRELESEVRSLRRTAASAGSVSCQRRMSDAVGSGGIQFANNKTDIRADAAQTIDRLIAIAQDCDDTRITVKGHTDTSGDRSYNLQLSQRRADAVVAYMERNGIDASRVEAIGVGPDEPIADNNTRAGRTQNRRIEIVVE